MGLGLRNPNSAQVPGGCSKRTRANLGVLWLEARVLGFRVLRGLQGLGFRGLYGVGVQGLGLLAPQNSISIVDLVVPDLPLKRIS